MSTRKRAQEYRAKAENADSKAKASRSAIMHLSDKLQDRVDHAIKTSKQGLADDVKAHNAAQGAVAQPDAAKPIKEVEEKKEKPVKEKKEKTTTVKKAKKRKAQ